MRELIIEKILRKRDEKFIKKVTLDNLIRSFKYYKSKGKSDEEAEDLTLRFYVDIWSNEK